MSNSPNLWAPALQGATEESPFEFMKTQGEVLREQTNGLLWGEVVPFVQGNVTYHEFRIASSRLGEYRCVLLRTAYGKHIYPLFLYDYSESEDAVKESNKTFREVDLNPLSLAFRFKIEVENTKGDFIAAPPDYKASNYSEFENIFSTILQSKGTRAIIQSLLIQGNPSPVRVNK